MVVILFCTPKILLLWVILFLGYPVGLKSFRERYCSSPTGLRRLTFEIVKERCSLITPFRWCPTRFYWLIRPLFRARLSPLICGDHRARYVSRAGERVINF